MFQLSLKILLAVLMFVNLAFTVSIEEDLASKKSKNVSTDTENITHTNMSSHVIKTGNEDNQNKSFENADKNVTIIQKIPLNKEETASTKTLPATLHNSNFTLSVLEKEEKHINQKTTKRPVEETTPINQIIMEITNANGLTGEQKDLIKDSSVSSRDEEDVTTIEPILNKTNSSVTTITEATSSSTTLKSNTETITVDSVPIQKEEHNNETSDNEHNSNVKNITYHQTSEPINVAIKEDSKTTEMVESSSTPSKSIEITTLVSSENDQVEVGSSTVPVENEKEVVELNIKSKPLSSINEKDSDGSMPSGIIVLITALAFAVAIVVGYISIIIWKQYLEHRYGRRELLVNELEFDTNDLRHFEL